MGSFNMKIFTIKFRIKRPKVNTRSVKGKKHIELVKMKKKKNLEPKLESLTITLTCILKSILLNCICNEKDSVSKHINTETVLMYVF